MPIMLFDWMLYAGVAAVVIWILSAAIYVFRE